MKIKAQPRTETGTSAAKKARREGLVPAAIYGSSVDTVSVLLNRRDYEEVVREVGFNGVFDIEVEGGEAYQVFVKEQSNAAMADVIYHVDLQAFRAGEKVVMEIPLYLSGQDELENAIANQSLTFLEIEVAPSDAPNEIYVDVSELEIGDTVTVSDLELDENIEVITELDSTVVSVSPPEEEEEPVEGGEDAAMPEPEVITAKDDEEE